MNPWTQALPTMAAFLIVAWIILAGIAALLRRRRPPVRRRSDGPSIPSAQGPAAFARLLASTPRSAYSRDRIQERIRTLAADIASMERGIEDRTSRKAAEQALLAEEGLLAVYLAEDHVGFRGGLQRKSNRDEGFQARTEAALDQLERHIKGRQHG